MTTANPHLDDRDGALSTMLQALCDARRFEHAVEHFDLLETHISFVLLTGPYAYKFKKPVDFGFVNFETLERRKYYCEQELHLNRRLAPDFYLAVVPVTGSVVDPVFSGPGPVIEYAVKMKQFDPDRRLDHVVARGELLDEHIDSISKQVAGLHASADSAGLGRPYGTTALLREQTLENFEHLAWLARSEPNDGSVDALRDWSCRELERLASVFEQRRLLHRVKECHGDLHLANIAVHADRIVIFDCIEFNENLRWCDVMSEVAFLCMDLDYHRQARQARRFLADYLERTGDYEGLAVWRFYLAYRALVRAKVAHLRERQGDDEARTECRAHLGLARGYALGTRHPTLCITRGLSGSGKTTVTQCMVEQTPVVRVRSDIERKRLIGLPGNARTDSAVGAGAYSPELTQLTYDRLAELAEKILATGHSVIVDATFLHLRERERFARLARRQGVPFRILEVHADTAVLEQRLEKRKSLQSDAAEADVAVLRAQIASSEPLSAAEREFAVTLDTGLALDAPGLVRALGLESAPHP